MNKKLIITALLALIVTTGWAQNHQQDPQRNHFRQRIAPFLTKTLNPG